MPLAKRLAAGLLSFALVWASLPMPAFAQAVALGAAPIEGPLPGAGVFNGPQFIEWVAGLPELAPAGTGEEASLAADAALGRIAAEAAPAMARSGAGALLAARDGDRIVVLPMDRNLPPVHIDLRSKALIDARHVELGRRLKKAIEADRASGADVTASQTLSAIFDAAKTPASFVEEASGERSLQDPRSQLTGRDTHGIRFANSVHVPGPEVQRARNWLKITSAGFGGFAAAAAATTAALWHFAGEPWVLAASFPVFAVAFFHIRAVRRWFLNRETRKAEKLGGRLATKENAPELTATVARLAASAGIETPEIYIVPAAKGDTANTASARMVIGAKKGLLFVAEDLLRSPNQEAILGHELQHLKDFRRRRVTVALALAAARNFLWAGLYGAGATLYSFGALAFGAPTHFAYGLTLLASGALGAPLVWLAYRNVMEFRADLGAVAITGDHEGIARARAASKRVGLWRYKALIAALKDKGAPWSWAGLGFPAPAGPAAPAAPSGPDDKTPAYYTQPAPEWAARLSPNPGEVFASPADAAAYQRQLAELRPLARWMAHFFTVLKQNKIQRPPNLLTLQDVVNWGSMTRKLERQDGLGWPLKEAVLEALHMAFRRALPGDKFEGRELRQEFDAIQRDLEPALAALRLPEHLSRPALKTAKTAAEIDPSKEPDPVLFKAEESEAMDPPDMIVTPAVRDRIEDLASLYSTQHFEKYWPLIEGPTGEGKSSVIRYLFSLPGIKDTKAIGGRNIPVVSIPVKESMTNRELFGGLTTHGVEYGFFTLAVQNGWVLVLEELDQASGEFKKSLNKALHQIRKDGYFEFELGGRTHRIQAHPHFWLVGTKNGAEGNFSFTRNPDPPDFVKRFVLRVFDRIPPAEQAEIMRGLAVKWYGEEFVQRQGLTVAFFEKLMTAFHEPVRKLVAAGRLGGDYQEPYEFNRRTLHRFLARWLADMEQWERSGVRLHKRGRYLLMARELMEAYGTEVRQQVERKSIWDVMNVAFNLQGDLDLKIKHQLAPGDKQQGYEDIQIEVRSLRREGDYLVVDEKLVPMSILVRKDGGDRVMGPSSRLTLVPSLALSLYRNLRNRQFHEPQFSTGPTGAAKTSEIFFLSNLLGEPLFDINMHEQTSPGELHGQLVRDRETGDPKMYPGILARAMMYDPKGLLKRGPDGKMSMSPNEVRKSPHIGATLLIDEANANTLIETINPALDNGVLNLKDGRHTAIAGGGAHFVIAMNPVGEGYAGYPLTEAIRSRGQTVFHPGDLPEEELTEILLDQLTGITRYQLDGKVGP